MSNTNTGGPAFPRDHAHEGHNGLTACEYAAIQLKVPDSGTDWLDDMIRAAQRNELAAQAMNAFLSRDGSTLGQDAEAAYMMADAMLKASKP